MKKQNKNITKDFFTATYLFTIWFIKSFPLVLLHCFTLGITLPLPFYSIHTHHRDFYSRGSSPLPFYYLRLSKVCFSTWRDYPILQRLGLDPRFVHIHNRVVDNKKTIIKSWSYGDVYYYVLQMDINNVTLSDIEKFITSSLNKKGAVYAIMPILINDEVIPSERFISISGQLITTKDVNPRAILNNLEFNILKLIPDYGFDGKLRGIIVFKWRIISYNLGMVNIIGDKISDTSLINYVRNEDDFTFSDILPMSFDLKKYGNIINKDLNQGVKYKYTEDISILIHNSNIPNERNITVFKDDAIFAQSLDVLYSDGTLIRTYDNGVKLYIDNKKNILKYFERSLNCSPLAICDMDLIKDEKISAFDIESYSDKDKNGIFIAYACGFIKPNHEVLTYYLTDFNNSRDMLKKCLMDMLESRPKLGVVYVHNLSRFDTFFIDPILLDDNDIIAKYKYNKDGKILSINVSSKDKKRRFIFRDSLLMIPGSLKNLSLSFNSVKTKGDFPHSFASHDTLEYIGVKPDISYYDNISKDKYDLIPVNWNLREDLINYLKYDLASLQEIMIKFANDIYKLEKINITKVATTSSLAFKSIFTNYVKPNLFYKVKGPAHNSMRRAFFGGVTEVYNLNPIGKLAIYDLNSSYPASMKLPMPVGKPILSNDKNLDNYFGVVFAKIKTPRDNNGKYIQINYPPLPFRVSEIKLVNPIGSWSGMYCSEILKFVRDIYKYEVEVIYGYKYESAENIFAGFVDKYYDIKSGFNKDTNINKSTAKLMLNGAFGRTGLKLDESVVEITTSERSKELQCKYNVKKILERSPDIHWVSYERIINPFYIKDCETLDDNIIHRAKENNSQYDAEQCLPIAIFTTAYSTIRLFEAIRRLEESGKEIYAVDTDSIHTNGELPEDLVGNELGKWKLEFVGYKGGFYPLPKLYYAEGYEVKDNILSDKISILKKAKGVKRGTITKDEYKKLINGLSIEKSDPRFVINREDSTVSLKDVKIKIKPDLIKRKIVRQGYNLGTMPHLVIDGVIQD